MIHAYNLSKFQKKYESKSFDKINLRIASKISQISILIDTVNFESSFTTLL